MVVNGSLSKTAVNAGAGAKSQLSGLVVAALTVVTLLFLTGLFEKLPEATLAAVVIAALIELVDVPALIALYRLHTAGLRRIYGVAARADFIAAVAALLGVLVFDTLPGLFIGIVVSLLLLLYRASRPHVAVLGAIPGRLGSTPTSTATRRTSRCPASSSCGSKAGSSSPTPTPSRTAFAHARRSRARQAVVLDAETVPFIDVTAATMLAELAAELERDGVRTAGRPRHRPGPRRPARRRGRASDPDVPDRRGRGRRQPGPGRVARSERFTQTG